MHEPRFEAPRSLQEVTRALQSARCGGAGRVHLLAGGTDLLVQMHAGHVRPQTIIDVKRVPELGALRWDGGALDIGAALCAAAIREDPRVQERFPGFAEALGLIGSDQIQGRASLGGNLCNASPAADTTPSLIALGAICTIAGAAGHTRALPAEAFVRGPGETALTEDELLVSVRLPAPAPRSADAYLRLIPRTEMDIAVAGAAVQVELDTSGRCTAARVALGAVAPTAFSCPAAAAALVGSRGEPAALAGAASAARESARPIGDQRAPADYRRAVAGVLCQRAGAIAFARARER